MPSPKADPFGLPGIACHQRRFTAADALAAPGITLPPSVLAAVPLRRAEFLAGRLCAALALRDLGCSTPDDVPVNPDRSPRWPPGFLGSISHSAGHAIAVAATTRTHSLLGIDLEPLMPPDVAQEVAPDILSPGDAAHCPPGLPFAAFVTTVFSAKEALYKAIHPRLLRVIPFHAARLTAFGPHDLRLALDEDLRAALGLAPDLGLRIHQGATSCLCLLAAPA
ncbi:4'-phosphopantetheinyl transferase superfamily protein [Paracoccaceae bacterium Fryx2]|nr:4'-phosphopantetheinyl transferase superfamily protein [Paracoccaceae bacterium Fryx2]